MGLFSRRTTEPVLPAKPLTPADVVAVRAAFRSGGPVKSVMVVKDLTGLGLKQAKELSEAIRDGRYVPPPRAGQDTAADPPGPQQGSDQVDLATRARQLKASGEWHSAAAAVMAETGMSRREADRFVAALEA